MVVPSDLDRTAKNYSKKAKHKIPSKNSRPFNKQKIHRNRPAKQKNKIKGIWNLAREGDKLFHWYKIANMAYALDARTIRSDTRESGQTYTSPPRWKSSFLLSFPSSLPLVKMKYALDWWTRSQMMMSPDSWWWSRMDALLVLRTLA